MTIEPHEAECMADMLRQATELEEWTTVERVTEMLRTMTTTQQQPAAEGEPLSYLRQFDVDHIARKMTGQAQCIIYSTPPNKNAVAIYTAAPAKVAVSDAAMRERAERAEAQVAIALKYLQRINNDDGEEFLNLSCDAMDEIVALDPTELAASGAQGEGS